MSRSTVLPNPRWVFFLAAATLVPGFTLPAQAQPVAQQPQLMQTPECSIPGAPGCQNAATPSSPGGDVLSVPQTAVETPVNVPRTATTAIVPLPPEQTPEPETEFQRFVTSSVGHTLDIFGKSLFSRVPTTFAPLNNVPVTADYVVGPGDEIDLRVWGQVNLNLQLFVDATGSVFVPQVGNFSVAGLQFQQLAGFFRAQLSAVYRNFDLTVNMGQLKSIQVFVVGQVRKPGAYTVSSLSTLIDAIFASGGPSSIGSMRDIQLKRGAQIVTTLDLYDFLLNGDKSKDARLLAGDVIYIPTVGPQVAISGSLKNPAIFELKNEKTIAELLKMAGGLTAVADEQRAVLERIGNRGVRSTVEFALNGTGLATTLKDGDVVRILTITPRITDVVTLRGNVANEGRFPWHPGMRLRDVIPDKESLITRHYWNNRNSIGFTPVETFGATQNTTTNLNTAATGSEVANAQVTGSLRTQLIPQSAPNINWSYAVIERPNPQDLNATLVPFHPGKLILENDNSENLELRPGDVITVFSQDDIRVPRTELRRRIRLEGEIKYGGIYDALPGETLGQLIQRAGGLTGDAYLFGSVLERESVRQQQVTTRDQFVREMTIELRQGLVIRNNGTVSTDTAAEIAANNAEAQNLIREIQSLDPTGRIVLPVLPERNDLAPLMNVALEDGDRFVVPSRPLTVLVSGAVYNQNVILHEPGLRVNDYLAGAGGFTTNADKRHPFIIRANGQIVPRAALGLFSRTFESSRLYPGDAVVVPIVMFRGDFMRAVRDWTQVFSQLGLGAAAINVLK
jgi:protein involved in polysaccharide export with SLBB domain